MAKDPSTPTNASTGNSASLTPRDMQLLCAAMQSTQGEFKIDFQAFADKGGLKNVNSARVTWRNLKQKLDKLSADAGGGDDGLKNDNGDGEETAKGLKRGGVEDADGEEVETSAKKAKKGGKGRGKGAKSVVADMVEGEGEGEVEEGETKAGAGDGD